MEELFSRIAVLPDLAAARLLQELSYENVEQHCKKGSLFEMRFCGDSEDTFKTGIYPGFIPTSTMFRVFFMRDFGISEDPEKCAIGNNQMKNQLAKSFESHFPSVGGKYFDLKIIRKLKRAYKAIRSANFRFSLRFPLRDPNGLTTYVKFSGLAEFRMGTAIVSFSSRAVQNNTLINGVKGFFFCPLLDILFDPNDEEPKVRVLDENLSGLESTDPADFLGVRCTVTDNDPPEVRAALTLLKKITTSPLGFSQSGDVSPGFGFFSLIGHDSERGVVVQTLDDSRYLHAYENSWMQGENFEKFRTEKMQPRQDEASLSTIINTYNHSISFKTDQTKTTISVIHNQCNVAGDYEFFALYSDTTALVSKYRYFIGYLTVPPSLEIGKSSNNVDGLFSDPQNDVDGIYRRERGFAGVNAFRVDGIFVRRVDEFGGIFSVVVGGMITIPETQEKILFVDLIEASQGSKRLVRKASITLPFPSIYRVDWGIRSIAIAGKLTAVLFDFDAKIGKLVRFKENQGPQADDFKTGSMDRHLSNFFVRISPDRIQEIVLKKIRFLS